MSHLLTRLADRALGTAPGIEPVRSPVFYGGPAGPENTAAHEPAGFTFSEIVTGKQSAQPATMDSSAAHSNDVAARVEPRVEQGDTLNASVPTASSRVLHEPSAAADNNLSPRRSHVQQHSEEPVDSSVQVASLSRLTETVPSDPEPSLALRSPVTPRASQSAQIDSPLNDRATMATDPFSERPAFSDPQVQTTAETMLRPRAFPEPDFSERGAIETFTKHGAVTRTGQPTIKVTIGCIEVRAVTTTPAPAPRQRKKPQPSLSLDEYLKQRAGGKQ